MVSAFAFSSWNFICAANFTGDTTPYNTKKILKWIIWATHKVRIAQKERKNPCIHILVFIVNSSPPGTENIWNLISKLKFNIEIWNII